VQEALTNCIRHAQAHSITVTIGGGPDRLDLTITDDGVGLDMERKGDGLACAASRSASANSTAS
jgi:signal transduction histidine kinase